MLLSKTTLRVNETLLLLCDLTASGHYLPKEYIQSITRNFTKENPKVIQAFNFHRNQFWVYFYTDITESQQDSTVEEIERIILNHLSPENPDLRIEELNKFFHTIRESAESSSEIVLHWFFFKIIVQQMVPREIHITPTNCKKCSFEQQDDFEILCAEGINHHINRKLSYNIAFGRWLFGRFLCIEFVLGVFALLNMAVMNFYFFYSFSFLEHVIFVHCLAHVGTCIFIFVHTVRYYAFGQSRTSRFILDLDLLPGFKTPLRTSLAFLVVSIVMLGATCIYIYQTCQRKLNSLRTYHNRTFDKYHVV